MQTVFKILKRLGIDTTKQRDSSRRNQLVAYITQTDLERVAIELQAIAERDESDLSDNEGGDDFISAKTGVFYLIQLEPQFDPGRFKVGFAASISERLRSLRCCAPFATVIRSWPCRRLWEKTAIDSVSAGCDRIHTEVFRAESMDEIVAKCERFFAVMSSDSRPTPADE